MAKGIKTRPALVINMGGAQDCVKRKITEADYRKIAGTKRVRVTNASEVGVFEQVDSRKVPELPNSGFETINAYSVVFIQTGNTYSNLDEGALGRAVYLYVYAQRDENDELIGYFAMIYPFEI